MEDNQGHYGCPSIEGQHYGCNRSRPMVSIGLPTAGTWPSQLGDDYESTDDELGAGEALNNSDYRVPPLRVAWGRGGGGK